MISKNKFYLILVAFISILLHSCTDQGGGGTIGDTPYTLKYPTYFGSPNIPADNPLTVNKVYLGRMLFYEKGISEDQQISCASCHIQRFAFGDSNKLSTKVNHGSTTRNTSVLYNLAFTKNFFWDGRTTTLESTCQDAIVGEQHFDISFVKSRLMTKPEYQKYFQLAFQTTNPTNDMVIKAIASFIRTMVSAGSKVDKGIAEGDPNKYLNASESLGKAMFEDTRGDCFHCHGDAFGVPLMTDNKFHNNGLENFTDVSQYIDKGLGKTTGNTLDYGKFKTPSLRNLSFSAPYMHDGRFATLDDALEHYNSGVQHSPNIDPNMHNVNQGGIHLSVASLANLKAYLLSFNDYNLVQDTTLSSPFK